MSEQRFVVGYWSTETGRLRYHSYIFENEARARGRAVKYSETPGVRLAFVSTGRSDGDLVAEYDSGEEVHRVPNEYGGFVRRPVK